MKLKIEKITSKIECFWRLQKNKTEGEDKLMDSISNAVNQEHKSADAVNQEHKSAYAVYSDACAVLCKVEERLAELKAEIDAFYVSYEAVETVFRSADVVEDEAQRDVEDAVATGDDLALASARKAVEALRAGREGRRLAYHEAGKHLNELSRKYKTVFAECKAAELAVENADRVYRAAEIEVFSPA